MAQLVKAPQLPPLLHPVRLFLAGTTPVHGSSAPDWRGLVWSAVADLPVTVIDPVRADWGAGWTEDPDTCAPFREQVQWELRMQTADATHAVFYFDPHKDGMVSLLELGLALGSGRVQTVAVCCPRGYIKRGNVVMVCRQFGVPVVDTAEQLASHVRALLE